MLILAVLAWRAGRARISRGLGLVDIIWHIGLHRTGSTTLQRFIEGNRAPLGALGIEAWTPMRTRAGLFTGLVHDPHALTGDQIDRGNRAAGLIGIETARAAAAGATTLVVSEENMTGSVKANLRAERLYPDIVPRLARMRQGFGHPIRRIGLAIRSYDTFWASSLTFALCNGRAMPTADDLDRLVTQPRRWRDLIRGVAAAVPEAEITVWPFETHAGAPAQTLAALAGRRLPVRLSAGTWANRSPRLDQIRTVLALRGDRAGVQNLPAGNGVWQPFDAEQAAALRAEYREDIDWLRAGADGLATFHERLSATTEPKAETYNNPLTETHEVKAAAATIAALTRTTGGQNHGTQRHLA